MKLKQFSTILIVWVSALLGSLQASGQAGISTEAAVKKAIGKAWPAAVKAFAYDTLQRAQAGGPFSAVVVSADGYMLTVAHATRPGNIYKVFFPDGKSALAKALGRIDTNAVETLPDIAVMKLLGNGPWPYAEMGYSGGLQKGSPCIMLAYPESTALPLPNVRFGYITQPMDKHGFVVSSCTMEVGDSGGPIFDLEGRVIGLNSRCEKHEEVNYHPPVDKYREYWSSLIKAVNYTKYPVADSNVVQPAPLNWSPVLPLVTINIPPQAMPVRIESKVNNHTLVSAGTIWNASRKGTWIIGKLSETGDTVLCNIKGKTQPLKILARNKENDLVLLFTKEMLSPTVFSMSPVTGQAAPAPGSFLYVPVPSGAQKRGVVSTTAMDMPPRSTAGYLGAMLIDKNDAVTVQFLDMSGPVGKAGIRHGDKFVQLNEEKPADANGFSHALLKFLPADTIHIVVQRGDSLMEKQIVLTERPEVPSQHLADQYEGGKSKVRDGFKGAWLCDAHVKATDCGAPVFGADGKCYGIVLARFSRTAAVVFPAAAINAWIKQVATEI